jgi:predicted RNase H-like HicB family nuclease
MDDKAGDANTVGRYSMVIEWDDVDRIFVVTVPELPGCRTHGRTHQEAVQQAQDAIESWIEAARADGEPIPAPRLVAGAARP